MSAKTGMRSDKNCNGQIKSYNKMKLWCKLILKKLKSFSWKYKLIKCYESFLIFISIVVFLLFNL